ncbi:hypothetical protein [Gemmata sp.]|uniref:hypothetical protein n=1 Tax=Gemmata sp. TaxID=1914242 RepID=UPI003F71D0C5
MVMVYVGGKAVSWADAEKVFAEAAQVQPVEFRDETGRVLATTVPRAEPAPAWEAAITPEETARRMAEPAYTFEEMKKRLGWQ